MLKLHCLEPFFLSLYPLFVCYPSRIFLWMSRCCFYGDFVFYLLPNFIYSKNLCKDFLKKQNHTLLLLFPQSTCVNLGKQDNINCLVFARGLKVIVQLFNRNLQTTKYFFSQNLSTCE